MICYWGSEKLRLNAPEIAKHFTISQPAVSKWVKKLRLQESQSSPFAKMGG